MKTSRALLLMLAGLAGGVGLRLAFAVPVGTEQSRRPQPANGKAAAVSASTAATAPSGGRPAEKEILTANAGTRHRLLMDWLPGAGEDELRRMAEALNKGDHDSLAILMLMVRWADVDPAGMLEWARAASRGKYNDSWLVSEAITAWARVDFDSAWAAAADGQPGTRTSALLGLAVADPDKCLGLLRADPRLLTLTGNTDIDDVLAEIAVHDPAAVAALLPSTPSASRGDIAGRIALAWVKSDPAAAIAWIKSLDPSLSGDESLKNAGQWIAAHAPEHLPALLDSLPPNNTRRAIEAAGITALAARDPAAARQQLDTMPASPARQYGRGLLLKELLSRGDDAGAAALASQLGWSFPDQWSPSWWESVYDPALGTRSTAGDGGDLLPVRQAMSELLGKIAARDPAQAAAVLAASEPRALHDLLTTLPAAQSAAVAGVLFNDGEGNTGRFLPTLAGHWMSQDPAAAATWALAHGTSIDQFFHHWSYNPPAALEWASALPAEQRQPLLEKTIPGWALNNSASIGNAISGSRLPAAEKQKLLTLVPLLPPLP